MSKKINLSIIITAHAEGLLAHKTLLSVFRALDPLKDAGYSYEIIINIDRGDKTTLDYFERYLSDPRFTILKTNFGDLGLSRNYARSKSHGEFVAYLDADDMISRNWYISAIHHIENSDHPVVVHPKANIIFGIDVETTLCIFRDSKSFATDALIALGANRWISTSVARKEIFDDTPYMATKNGFGHEDYFFNMQTLAKGVKHETAENSTHFYRRKPNSLMSFSNQNHVTQPYTDLFDIHKLQSLPPVTPTRKLVLKERIPPDYVREAMRDINSIDAEIQLTPEILKNGLPVFDPDTNNFNVAPVFQDLIQNIGHLPDYVFIVPWIVPGGADKVLLNYLNALKKLHPSWRIAVITTLPSENAWAKFLPNNTYHIDFGNLANWLNPSERDITLTRLLIQFKCPHLHIINSEYAYHWVMNHMDLVRHNFKLDVSVFSYVTTEHGLEYSYLDPCIREIYPVIDHVFTDNQAIINQAVAKNGFSQDKFKVHYQPVDLPITKPKSTPPHRPLRILWASRIDSSKCPELLVDIAKRLDPKDAHIDVFGRLVADYDKKIFAGVPSITYKGAYNGFASLPSDQYDLFLYTSRADGMPNILLEATAAGLPIISSIVGGIGDFIINEKTGIAITNINNPEAYIEAINQLNREKLLKLAKSAQKLLLERHSETTFVDSIRSDFKK